MKILALMTLILLASCTQTTKFGECVGINDTRQDNLVYKANSTNIVVGVIFSETVVVPLVVIFSDLYCPISTKPVK